MRINVLYQFNEKYAPFAGASITSLFENNKNTTQINVYILGEELSEDTNRKMLELAEKYKRNIEFKNTDTIIKNMKVWGIPSYRGSYAANMRLFIPFLIEDEIDKILYLDADTIVSSSVEELFSINMCEYALAMVMDSLGGKYKQEIGLKPEEAYYNSGVILFNMKNWNKYNCSNRIIEHIKKGNNQYTSPDQDILNVVCKNEIMCLTPDYNMQPVHLAFQLNDYYKCYSWKSYYSKEQIYKASKSIKIYHFFRFLGEFPWNKDNLHPDNDLFDKYIKLSPWKDYKKQKASTSVIMKIEKILYKVLPKGLFLRIFVLAHNVYTKRKAEIAH